MLSCRIWFSAPSFWMGDGLESRCVGRVYGADGAVRLTVERRKKNSFFKPTSQMCDRSPKNTKRSKTYEAYSDSKYRFPVKTSSKISL